MRDVSDHSIRHSSPERRSRFGRDALAFVALALALFAGCGEDSAGRSPSLDGPHALAQALRSQCGEADQTLAKFNDSNSRCSIGLIANAGSNRLAVTDLGLKNLSIADLDRGVPTATHIPVGERPVDVESGPAGSVAYTLNSVSNDLTVVDLWRLESAATIDLPETARDLATGPGPEDGGRLVAALVDPDRLWIRRGIRCRRPSADNPGCTSPTVSPVTRSLPGRPSEVAIGPRGDRAYVAFQNRRYLSVFALTSDGLTNAGGSSCRRGRNAAPCEIRKVGLSHGCSDGIDNDGDGLADQRDPQCWEPNGSESPEGIGRTQKTACNDGVDNDGDGLADRNDPECQAAADDSEESPLNPDASFPCSNGADDDGDGATDYPADSDCYGAHGRTETQIERTGAASVTVDPMGTFVYVADRANGQLLAIDAARLELIDAGTARADTAAPFQTSIGIPIGGRPTNVVGVVGRDIEWRDPETDGRGIVNYSYGAYVASDDGRTYFVETVDAQCEVREARRAELLSNRKFRIDSDAFDRSSERSCLVVPEFPLNKTDSSGTTVDACEQVDACVTCTEKRTFRECSAKCSDLDRNRIECRAAGREFEPSTRTRLVVNPKFVISDDNTSPGRVTSRGQCTAPSLYDTRLRDYAANNTGAPSNFTCNSPLRPQPLTSVADSSVLDRDSFDDIPHARLLRNAHVALQPPADGETSIQTSVQSRAADFRYRNETWSVNWEAKLPGMPRDDGLPAQSTRTVDTGDDTKTVVDFDPGNVDLCSSGARAGDRLILKTKPESGGDAPDRCSNFTTSEETERSTTPDNRDPYRTFRIASVRPDKLVLETIDRPVEDQSYADALPTRECFPQAVSYAIRAENTWIVRGSSSGFVNERTSELGRCVDRYDAGTGRLGGRVEPGDLHLGPYLSFYLHEGKVPPMRRPGDPYRYRFSVRRFYESRALSSDSSPLLPSDILLARRVNRGVKLLVSDVSRDFVWYRNFRAPEARVLE